MSVFTLDDLVACLSVRGVETKREMTEEGLSVYAWTVPMEPAARFVFRPETGRFIKSYRYFDSPDGEARIRTEHRSIKAALDVLQLPKPVSV